MEPGVAALFSYSRLNLCLSLPPSSHPLLKFTHSSLLPMKGSRCQTCSCGGWLYLSLFAQKPEQQKREWKHRPPEHLHTNATVQMTHVHMVASHTFTHINCLLNIHIHTFPLHRPVAHVPCFLFLLSAVRQCDRSPCGRGATCEETPGGYHCLCPPGWSGRTCQLGQWVRIQQLWLKCRCTSHIYM